jgi:membrane protein
MSELLSLSLETFRRASERQAGLFAAGVAYYMFLSLFPALIAVVFSYGLIADAETISGHAERLARFLPDDAASIVTRQLDSLASNPPSTLGWGALVAMLVTLWSASRGALNLIRAIQWIFGVETQRNVLRQRLLAVGVMAGTIGFAMLSIGLIAAVPPILAFFELDEAWVLLRNGRWLLLPFTVVSAIGVAFRLARRESIRPRTLITRGVLLASALWIVVSLGFSIYVDKLANYGETYGALTGVVVLMVWIWLGTLAVLFGAAFEAVSSERAAARHDGA